MTGTEWGLREFMSPEQLVGAQVVDVEKHLTTGPTCGTCSHLWEKGAHNRGFLKCDRLAGHGLDGPDMRRWWPACTRYEPSTPPKEITP